MSPEGDDDVAFPVSSEDRDESSSRVRPLSFQSWARSRNEPSSKPRPLSLQPRAHLREERPSGSRPLSYQPGADLGDEPSSRARPLSLPSWEAYRAKRRSRAGSPDTTLSRWASGFEDDYSAYLHDFELEQNPRHSHFDEDTDAEERPREAIEDRKNYVESRESQVDRAGENADLETADPNMVSESQENRSWLARLRLAVLHRKSRDAAKLPTTYSPR